MPLPVLPRALAPSLCALALLVGLSPPAAAADPPQPGRPTRSVSSGCTGSGLTPIAEVQGDGAATPMAGERVKVSGVVVADLRTGGHRGLFVQTPRRGGPGRPVAAGKPSAGIFVYAGASAPALDPRIRLGDRVEVSGTATEFNGLTQLSAHASDVADCGAGPPIAPTPLPFPSDAGARESVEAMLVTPAGPATVSGLDDVARLGEIELAGGSATPARVPTDVARPGSGEARAVAAANAGRRIFLDDGRTTNLAPEGLLPPYLSPSHPVRVGDQVESWGPTVLSFGFGRWRLQPTLPVSARTPRHERTTFDPTGSRSLRPADVGGDVKVASFNVENYFVHFGGRARGAEDAAALARQESKLVATIGALGADIVALQEVENSIAFDGGADPQAALEALVAALERVDGPGTWEHVGRPVELPGPGHEDVITSAIVFRADRVRPVGPPRAVEGGSVWSNAREPIAQTFVAGAATFTVVTNHLKSKSPGKPGGDNRDQGDGQGSWNGDRRRQAESLAEFAAELRRDSGSDEVLLVGDFNSYSREDPVRDLEANGFTDLARHLPSGSHSYVYGGEEGSLDHVLASEAILARVTGFTTWETGAHEAGVFGYDGLPAFYEPDPFRSSDHNPQVVGLDVTGATHRCPPEPLTSENFPPCRG